ncbi:MAG: hypothetical protein KAJ63_13630 [Methyloprofundus sp.]|nr:hypothetical protein [Methyloprofundus sp.]
MNPINLSPVLTELNSQFLAIKASAVFTPHGTMLSNALDLNADKNKFSALTHFLIECAAGVSKLLSSDQSLELLIQCAEENLVVIEVYEGLLLALLVSSSDLLELDLQAVQMFLNDHEQ